MSLGLIGRLDYWSKFPFIEWTGVTPTNFVRQNDNSIAEEDFLSLNRCSPFHHARWTTDGSITVLP